MEMFVTATLMMGMAVAMFELIMWALKKVW